MALEETLGLEPAGELPVCRRMGRFLSVVVVMCAGSVGVWSLVCEGGRVDAVVVARAALVQAAVGVRCSRFGRVGGGAAVGGGVAHGCVLGVDGCLRT